MNEKLNDRFNLCNILNTLRKSDRERGKEKERKNKRGRYRERERARH